MLTSTAVSTLSVLLVALVDEGAGAGAALMSTCRAESTGDNILTFEQLRQSSQWDI